MTGDEFQEWKHSAFHELVDKNDKWMKAFDINSFPKWHYDQELGLLVFSKDGVPQVSAEFEAAGSLSKHHPSWLWAWDNETIYDCVKQRIARVREFGLAHGIEKLIEPCWTADLNDAWEMTAIACRILEGVGAYRCPNETGYLFVIVTSVRYSGDA
jgi:hypothetical protein